MKTFLKLIAITLPLIVISPTFARAHFGIDIHVGPPPLRHEIICERPYADAVWAPGYYNHVGYRYVWVPGYWRRPAYYRGEGWRHERFEHRNWERDRDHREWHRDRHEGKSGNEHDRGRGGPEHREGRIR